MNQEFNAFDAELKRTFAEAPGFEPADDGFSVAVSRRVARGERFAATLRIAQSVGYAAAGAAVALGAVGLAQTLGPQILTSFGADVARAYGGLNQISTMGAGLTQALMVLAAAAGGAVAVRSSQD